jgi:hypothetical protein
VREISPRAHVIIARVAEKLAKNIEGIEKFCDGFSLTASAGLAGDIRRRRVIV